MKSSLTAMRENINEKLIIENQLLSNENLRLRESYAELLSEYLNLLQNKMPQNHIDLGEDIGRIKLVRNIDCNLFCWLLQDHNFLKLYHIWMQF